MGLFDVLRVFQRFWSLIVILVAAGLAAGAGALVLVDTTYTSTSSIFISTRSLGTAGELLQGSTYTQARMLSYAKVASDPIVLDPVIQELGLKTTSTQLAQQVSASAQQDELIIDITAHADTAIGASDIVNAVAEQLSKVITEKIEAPVAGSDPFVSATITKSAVPSKSPSWPIPWIFLTVGGVAGLLLGTGLAFLGSALDSRVRNLADVQRVLTVPILGMISKDRGLRRRHPLEMVTGRNTFAEAIRALRTNLQFVDAEGVDRRILLVTSTVPGEGKSTTSLSLAAVLAEGGKRVALIDADLRRPTIASITDIEGGVGLTDVLLHSVDLHTALQPVAEHGRLFVLAAGRIPPNPAELLRSPQFAQLIAEIRSTFDYIVIDSPPVLAVADSLVLSRIVDAVLVVVGVERVRRQQVETAMTALRQVKAPVAGVVMNRLARSGVDAYAYYAYGYTSAGEKDHEAPERRVPHEPEEPRAERAPAKSAVTAAPVETPHPEPDRHQDELEALVATGQGVRGAEPDGAAVHRPAGHHSRRARRQ